MEKLKLDHYQVRVIKDMVTSSEYRHVPTGTLAVLAQRLGRVWASPSTLYHLVRTYGWRSTAGPCAPGQAQDWAAHDASR